MAEKYYPLNNQFAAVSLLGLIVFSLLTYGESLSLTWGFTFTLFFAVLFTASILTLKPTVYEYE